MTAAFSKLGPCKQTAKMKEEENMQPQGVTAIDYSEEEAKKRAAEWAETLPDAE